MTRHNKVLYKTELDCVLCFVVIHFFMICFELQCATWTAHHNKTRKTKDKSDLDRKSLRTDT